MPPSLLLSLSVLSLIPIVFSRMTDRQDLAFVHTFDTREMCMSRCRTTCTQHHSEDLMMPRWSCPLQENDSSLMEEEDDDLFTNSLLIGIPLCIFGGIAFLFVCVSCVQRFCRDDM